MSEVNSSVKIEYRQIPNYPAYLVGNDGTVWSLWAQHGTGRGNSPIRYIGTKKRKLNPSLDRYGRPVVNLHFDNRVIQRKVCQLVLEAFIGPRPKGMQACHFPDPSTDNNNLENLRWDTQSGNMKDRVIHGTSNQGERCGTAKLKCEDVREIRLAHSLNLADKDELSKKYGVSPGNIYHILKRHTWKHVT